MTPTTTTTTLPIASFFVATAAIVALYVAASLDDDARRFRRIIDGGLFAVVIAVALAAFVSFVVRDGTEGDGFVDPGKGYLSVLHLSPPPNDVLGRCVADSDVDERVGEALRGLEGKLLVEVVDGTSRCELAVENALELSPSSRVLWATRRRRCLVMRAPASTAERRLRGGFSREVLTRTTFVCSSEGAARVVRLLAAASGAPSSALDVVRGTELPASSPSGRLAVLCSLRSPDPSASSATRSALDDGGGGGAMRIVEYVTPAMRRWLEVKAPYVRVAGAFVTDVAPELAVSRQQIVELAGAEDLLVVASSSLGTTAAVRAVCERLVASATPQDIARNTFYSHVVSFPYVPAALEFLALRSATIARTTMPRQGEIAGFAGFVAEAFSSSESRRPLRFVVDSGALDLRRIESLHGGRVTVIEPREARIDGVPLRTGDRLVLQAQDRRVENGEYVVASVSASGAAAAESPPVLRDLRGASRRLLEGGERVLVRTVPGPFPEVPSLGLSRGERVFVEPLLVLGRLLDDEGRNVLLDEQGVGGGLDDATKFHPLARCATDDTIAIRELCEASVDASGAPKKAGVWDRPCERDADCPFFGGGASVRGGCMDSGYCEMPLGVRQVSYTRYEGEPWCAGEEGCIGQRGSVLFRG